MDKEYPGIASGMTSNYQYQIQPLPEINVIGANFVTAAQVANMPPLNGSQTPIISPSATAGSGGGGGGGGSLPGTVDLDLCDGSAVRVYGYLI